MGNFQALVVEDDINLANIFAIVLGAQGWEVQVVHYGDEALEQIGATHPHLVVLDVNLPYVSGTEILREIRANSDLAATKVIIATANARAAEQITEEGLADIVLNKPLRVQDIIAFSQRLMGNAAANQVPVIDGDL